MKPSQAIEPEVSFTVVLRLRPVAARADVSPIVSVADTRNIQYNGYNGASMKFRLKWHNRWQCNY